jgi:hypothetical protein
MAADQLRAYAARIEALGRLLRHLAEARPETRPCGAHVYGDGAHVYGDGEIALGVHSHGQERAEVEAVAKLLDLTPEEQSYDHDGEVVIHHRARGDWEGVALVVTAVEWKSKGGEPR